MENVIRIVDHTALSYPDKYNLNSKYDNLNFIDNKAVTLLPSILKKRDYKPFAFDNKNIPDNLINEDANPEIDNLDSLAFHYLSILLRELEKGFYRFEFYFYISCSDKNFTFNNIYMMDDKISLDNLFTIKKVSNNHGFKNLITLDLEKVNENYTQDTLIMVESIQSTLEAMEQVNSWPTDVKVNKKTGFLLVITKDPKNNY